MKRLSTWDTYVKEAKAQGDRSIEIPLTTDDVYIVNYPTRRQGRQIVECQLKGDTDGVLVGLIGEVAGARVKELAEDEPAFVLDAFIVDVMKKFGMIPDDEEPTPLVSVTDGRSKGKGPSSRRVTSSSATKRKPSSARLSAASS